MATEGHPKKQTWNDLRPAQPIRPNFTKRRTIRDVISSGKKGNKVNHTQKKMVINTSPKDDERKKQIAALLGRAHKSRASQSKKSLVTITRVKEATAFSKKRIVFALSVASFIVLLSGVAIATHHGASKIVTPTGLPTAPTLQKGTPSYATILPSGKTAESLGGWTRVSPPDRNPVFAFIDTLNKTPISVSEQPLPSDFTNNTDAKIQELATNYNATQKIPIGPMTVYIGTSTNGPQSLIFYKNNLLILIKSAERIENTIWSTYINSLQ